MHENHPHLDGRDTLDVVAGKIVAYWRKSDDQRLSAALLLREAKERVENGEDRRFANFRDWCRAKLPGRSDDDIGRLLRYANSPDPEAALNEDRARSRERSRRWRASRSASAASASSPGDVRTPDRETEDFTQNEGSVEDEIRDFGEDVDVIFERALAYFRRQRSRPMDVRIDMARRLLEALDLEIPAELEPVS
jgi:hypothetical protein